MQEQYDELCRQIWRHNRLYYVENAPIIPDEQFDLLLKRLEQMEKEHPELVRPDSPTQRVGEVATDGFKTVRHVPPMLSLANTYSEEELASFIKRMQKWAGLSLLDYSCELKMDGIAISVRYERGKYVRAATRGNGKEGDEVTQNVRTIDSLPLSLYGESVPQMLEVRGEVYMPHEAFVKLNRERKERGDPPFANPRNAAGGSLKLLDPKEVIKRELKIAFYGIAEGAFAQKQYEMHSELRSLGLPSLARTRLCHNLHEILEFAKQVAQERASYLFDIDGIVVKLNDLTLQQELGTTGKSPRWAVAYKFAAEQAVARIRDIIVQVGRTGTLTPVAELEPTFLAGSMISRATLHNREEIQRKDIRIKDFVTIEKGGDVIPKVVSVDLSKRPKDAIPWKMPQECPSCNTPVIHKEGEVAVKCPNKNCPDQFSRSILYFVGKQGMDIESIGEKVVEQLIQKGLVRTPADLYELADKDLLQLDGFKEKSVSNVLQNIEKSKNVALDRFIMALGIHHIGSGMAELIAQKAGSIEDFLEMNEEEFLSIDGVGEKGAKSLTTYLSDPENLTEIRRLLALGVFPRPFTKVASAHQFSGKIFVLTGTLTYFTRDQAAAIIKERGGKTSSSVSKKTDFVLAGESAGTKLTKARELGVHVLSEEAFKKML